MLNNSTKKGSLFIISGPSGAGKGTIVKKVLPLFPNMVLSVSATTRLPRQNEKNGVDYFFIDKADFLKMIADSEFLEYDDHFENYYGTPKRFVFEKLDEGKDVLLEIDVRGALKVKSNYPDAVAVFVMPSSTEELKKRLVRRNTESVEAIEKRLARVEKELELKHRYDFIVINDDLDTAVKQVEQIIKENR